MAGGGGGADNGEPEFQIAPMLDVLFVMLVFFMTITSVQVFKVDKTIELPVAPNAQKRDDRRGEAIVNVRWDPAARRAQFVYDDQVYERATEIIAPLKAAKASGDANVTQRENPDFRAVIRADAAVPAVHVSHAMNACAEAGISDIAFSALNKR